MSVTLRASDKKEFTIGRSAAERSVLLRNVLEDIGDNNDIIPLPNVDGPTLEKVINYCNHHVNDKPSDLNEEKESLERSKRSEDISDWDAEFIKMSASELARLILAANYLDIQSLLDLGCRIVAGSIKGLSPQEIRERFHIEDDLTDEEKLQITRENEWAFDA